MKIFTRTLLVITALKALAMTSSAVVLDWSSLPSGQSWTNGDFTNPFNVDGTNAGNDITVSVVNNGASLTSGWPQNSNTAPGVIHDANYLSIRGGMVNSSNSVSVTITFNYALGVNNVSFSIIDVDSANSDSSYIDRISAISATPVGGPADSVALTGVSADTGVTTVTGSGTLGMVATANSLPNGVSDHTGDVTFTSDGTAITSITFTWNNPGPLFDTQVIALGNISFTAVPVPEIGSSFGALATCGGLFVAWRRRPARRGLAVA